MTSVLASPSRRVRRDARSSGALEDETPVSWVMRAPDAPYFVLDTGEAWHPIGANESVTWPELAGLFRRRDPDAVERHLRWLRASGVTVLRLMLEYCQGEHRYIERPAGRFVPAMVRLWDDLFAMCARVGMRILLTPFDTFFHWRRWRHHPYNVRNGGPCASRAQLLTCPDTREHVKQRLAFATTRWGGTGVLFAWDLWNELHPAQAGGDLNAMRDFVSDVSASLRATEIALHGRAHLQTVSVFGPALRERPVLRDLVFRDPALDFATIHLYAEETIDRPRDTIAPAVATGALVRESLAEIRDGRPFLDSEHGPIHVFKDHHRTLPAEFDDEYFRHMQWAHIASGGAGGGMRWPNRHPHVLTGGMREAQRAMYDFLPLIDWMRFARRPFDDVAVVVRDMDSGIPLRHAVATQPADPAEAPIVDLAGAEVAVFGCGDEAQALIYLLRADRRARDGRVVRDGDVRCVTIDVPGLGRGAYVVTLFDTVRGEPIEERRVKQGGETLRIAGVPLVADVAIAVRRATSE